MTAFLVANMAPIMFTCLVLVIVLGYPIAFSLAALGLFFGYLGIELGLFAPVFFQALPHRVFSVMANETLLAIPFFTFMGLVLERSRMAEDLLDTLGQLFGAMRGGLAYAVVFVGAVMAATTGVVAAAVISMGLISLPIMLRYGYDRRFATGVIVASGTLAQILPPSLVLIVLADQLGQSVGDMYAGAMLPALMLVGLFAVLVFIISLIRPNMVPPMPPEACTLGKGLLSLWVLISLSLLIGWGATAWFRPRVEQAPYVFGAAIGVLFAFSSAWTSQKLDHRLMSELAERVTLVLVPPLALIFLVLGTIFIGLATPTEGGAMGAVGALILAALKGRLTVTMTRGAAEATLRLSAFVMFVLIGARVFALTFYGVNGNIWVKDLMLALPGGPTGFLLFVALVVFVLGFFLDFFEIVFILVPLLIAPAEVLGIDLVWFGVFLAINFQTSFLTPPFGFSLFYLRSVAPKKDYIDAVTGRPIRRVTTGDIYRGVIPFVMVQLVMLLVVSIFPETVTHYQADLVFLSDEEVLQQLDNLGGPALDTDAEGSSNDMFTAPGMDMFTPPSLD